MAADLDLLKSFVDGQGVGAANYFVYATDLDTNFTDIENGVNAINAEVKAFSGNNAVLILDVLRAAARLTGFIDDTSFAPVSFISGDTQIVIPVGVALTGGAGRVELLQAATLTGSGAAVTFFVALQENGTASLETVSAQGVMDLYSVDWDGAVFTTATLLRLETIIPGGEDLFDQQSVVGVTGGAIPPQDHDRIANRMENVERVLNGIRTNVVAGAEDIGPIPGSAAAFSGSRVNFLTVATVSAGTTALLSRVRDTTDAFDIEWTGTLTADITSSGAGGLDTGAEAGDTWYALYVIDDSAGVNAVDVILSTSFALPTFPAGYDLARRVGAIRNDSASDFLDFIQFEAGLDRFYLYFNDSRTALQVLAAGSALAFATVSLAAFVPPSSRRAYMRFDWDPQSPGSDIGVRVPGSAVTREETYFSIQVGVNLSADFRETAEIYTDASQDIEYSVSAGADNIDMSVMGFWDQLGSL